MTTAEEKVAADKVAAEAAAVAKGDQGSGDGSGSDQKKDVPVAIYEETKKDMLRYKQEKKDLTARLDTLEQTAKDAETKRLEGQQEFKTLYETEKDRADKLQGSLDTHMIRSAIRTEAAALGAVNVKDANFNALPGVSILDGEISGVADALKDLAKSQPYLFKPADNAGADGDGSTSPAPGTVENKPGATQVDSVKYEDLLEDGTKMAAFRKEHRAIYDKLKEEYLKNRKFPGRK